MNKTLLSPSADGLRYELHDPTAMPRAASFLWNRKMMLHVNCRGFVVAQHMQPEPGKYAYAPNFEAKSFMQPEQPYYAHHPGRFFYIKDEDNGELFSAPYEPVRKRAQRYVFSVGRSDIAWQIRDLGIEIAMTLTLPVDDAVELWTFSVRNVSGRARRLSLYPYFPIGYMSWMNQSAAYREDLGGVVATCVTPYQKVADYPIVKTLKDKTYLLHDTAPVAWELSRESFEGEGGLHAPTAIRAERLACGDALYESPAAVLQYRETLANDGHAQFRFLFGPAHDDAEIVALRARYFAPFGFERFGRDYADYIAKGDGVLKIQTPDPDFDRFVNHWLARQVYYHGDVNRLTTDPQTRNYLQDNMGMSYLLPEVARTAFLHALSQQEPSGAMPDGILIHDKAELKYINQIPHTDHCVWLPVCLQAYLDETGDDSLLAEPVKSTAHGDTATVFDRVTQAMRWLLRDRDARGLSYIAQGDWCDPMNMVGHRGKGVSGWLSIAAVYAIKLWAAVAARLQRTEIADELLRGADDLTRAVQRHLWDGDWFARGITDDDVVFGVSTDPHGRIFLNPQSWALLADIATPAQRARMIQAIEAQLETPYGVELCAPAFTAMREDIGRVTQKFPGSAENGSVYNHAAAFYIHSLYRQGDGDRAFALLRRMLPGPDQDDYLRRGQMPVYIPNYYRGAYRQFPSAAGRSSHLFNTGTVAWIYRSTIEELFGVKGTPEGLRIAPQLPAHWRHATITRRFRGAIFEVTYQRGDTPCILLDGEVLNGNIIARFQPGTTYRVCVTVLD
jgi:cellobionic acid phosphorylase